MLFTRKRLGYFILSSFSKRRSLWLIILLLFVASTLFLSYTYFFDSSSSNNDGIERLHDVPPTSTVSKEIPSSPVFRRQGGGSGWFSSCPSSPAYPPYADLHMSGDVNFLVYAVYHDEVSFRKVKLWSSCRPWVRPLLVPTTPYLEAAAYRQLLTTRMQREWRDVSIVGLVSHRAIGKFPIEKLQLALELLHLNEPLAVGARHGGGDSPLDVVPLLNVGQRLMPHAVDKHSPLFPDVWQATLLACGYSLATSRRLEGAEAFLLHSFVTRPHWLLRLAEFMVSAMNRVEQDPSLTSLLLSLPPPLSHPSSFSSSFSSSSEVVVFVFFRY